MARIKYYYDTETCKYERIKVSKWDIFLNLLGFLSVSLILAVTLVFVFSKYFESPQVSLLKKENKELKLTLYCTTATKVVANTPLAVYTLCQISNSN